MMSRTIVVIGMLAATALGACGGSDAADSDGAGADPSRASEPGPSGEGKIAFSRGEGPEADRLSDIWVMNADGSGQTRLTEVALAEGVATSDENPAWSPDGKRIAFTRDEGRLSDIWVMNADGSDQTNLTNNRGFLVSSPTWSPDGKRIAFTRFEDNSHSDIWVMNADGSDQTNITDSPGSDEDTPAWSPDGERILVSLVRPEKSGIYVMNADGSGQRSLTSGLRERGVFTGSPTFSPDGKLIAFLALREEILYPTIWVMNADGSEQTPLAGTPTSPSAPTYSPDGRRIAFAFAGARDGPGIYVMNADGSDQTRLPDTRDGDRAPAWSPASGGSPIRVQG